MAAGVLLEFYGYVRSYDKDAKKVTLVNITGFYDKREKIVGYFPEDLFGRILEANIYQEWSRVRGEWFNDRGLLLIASIEDMGPVKKQEKIEVAAKPPPVVDYAMVNPTNTEKHSQFSIDYYDILAIKIK